jgi:hypothetical protein
MEDSNGVIHAFQDPRSPGTQLAATGQPLLVLAADGQHGAVRLGSASTGLAAVIMITIVLLGQVFRSGPVTGTRVQGAVAAYLCLGFAWADAYHIVALADPNAFNAAGTDVSVALNWMNYSFGMLTTIGYAGIVPIDSVAHTLCSAEAVTGQLYLAVLVARLVSMHVGAEEKSKQERLV